MYLNSSSGRSKKRSDGRVEEASERSIEDEWRSAYDKRATRVRFSTLSLAQKAVNGYGGRLARCARGRIADE
jgi:hypothetical protein